jgi:hypothetical protein
MVVSNVVQTYSIIFHARSSQAKLAKVAEILIIESLNCLLELVRVEALLRVLIDEVSQSVTELIKLSYDLNSISELTIEVSYSITIPASFCLEIFIAVVVKAIRKYRAVIISIAKNITVRSSRL